MRASPDPNKERGIIEGKKRREAVKRIRCSPAGGRTNGAASHKDSESSEMLLCVDGDTDSDPRYFSDYVRGS